MKWSDRGPIVWLLFFGMAIGFLVIVAEDSAAVERPTKPGPYHAGYFDENLSVTQHRYVLDAECRFYYPATSNGEGAGPDNSGAPYPPLIYHMYFEGYPDFEKYNRACERERIEFLVSHGFVVVTFTPFTRGISTERSFYNDLVNYTDSFNDNVSSPLLGMVKKGSYGALGEYWGGSLSFCHAAFTDRVSTVLSLGPFFGNNVSDINIAFTNKWNLKDKVWMIQRGAKDTAFEGHVYTQYEVINPEKMLVTIPKVGVRGPFRLDLVVIFFRYYLEGLEEEYSSLLYGDEAVNEALTGQYRFRYDIGDGEVIPFNPVFTIDFDSPVMMDEVVSFNVICDSYVLLDHPTLVHEWYLDDNDVPDLISTTSPNVTHIFKEPVTFGNVKYRYNIGNLSVPSNTRSLDVRNVRPFADPGENATIYQDDHFELDGSFSSDTQSDIDSLEYIWSIMGEMSGWSRDPTLTIDTSEPMTFTVSLWVKDRHEKVSKVSRSITISIINKPPTAIVEGDRTSDEDKVVELKGTGIDTRSHIGYLEFMWDYGDGGKSDWSSSPESNHTFSMEGTYLLTFYVRDPLGEENRSTQSITINNVVPEAGIDHPLDGSKEKTEAMVKFTGWGSDTLSDNGSLWYSWDFGDGRTADGPEVSHAFDEPGSYFVTLTVEDDDGATAVVTLTITIEEVQSSVDGPVVFTVTTGLLAMVLIAFVTITEPGKYWIGLMGSPLFIKTEDVLDNKTRHALLGVIVTNPGIHYTAIKQEFGLANGQAAYHLDVLERESIIRSVRDGRLKRFYSARAKVPRDELRSPEETREAIVELVEKRPGISQLEVMDELGIDRDSASYYLRDLVKEGRLKAGKEGKFTVYRMGKKVR